MDVVLGVIVLGVIFILAGGLENHDNKTEVGKEILADLSGIKKVEAENRGSCMMWGGLFIIVVIVVLAIASGEKF